MTSFESNLLFVSNKYPFRLACSSKNARASFTPANRNVSFHELDARLQSSDNPSFVFTLFSALELRKKCIANFITSEAFDAERLKLKGFATFASPLFVLPNIKLPPKNAFTPAVKSDAGESSFRPNVAYGANVPALP